MSYVENGMKLAKERNQWRQRIVVAMELHGLYNFVDRLIFNKYLYIIIYVYLFQYLLRYSNQTYYVLLYLFLNRLKLIVI